MYICVFVYIIYTHLYLYTYTHLQTLLSLSRVSRHCQLIVDTGHVVVIVFVLVTVLVTLRQELEYDYERVCVDNWHLPLPFDGTIILIIWDMAHHLSPEWHASFLSRGLTV